MWVLDKRPLLYHCRGEFGQHCVWRSSPWSWLTVCCLMKMLWPRSLKQRDLFSSSNGSASWIKCLSQQTGWIFRFLHSFFVLLGWMSLKADSDTVVCFNGRWMWRRSRRSWWSSSQDWSAVPLDRQRENCWPKTLLPSIASVTPSLFSRLWINAMRSSKARMTHLLTCQQNCKNPFDHWLFLMELLWLFFLI